MRRWQLLNRLRRAPRPYDPERCVLGVELLEAREVLSPAVSGPGFVAFPDENDSVTYSAGNESAFSVSNFGFESDTHRAVLTATNGTVTIDTALASSLALNPTGDGTPTVTLTGDLLSIQTVIYAGVTFHPTPYYSGDAALGLTVTDLDIPGDPPGSGAAALQVQPVVSDAFLTQSTFGQVFASSSGFAFPPGLVTIQNWPDADHSETATIIFQLDAEDPTGFTLSASGVTLDSVEPGQWEITATSAAELQAVFDSLVLTPPPGFTGQVGFSVFGYLSDRAHYGDGSQAASPGEAPLDLGEVDLSLRFFIGGNVTTPSAFAQEGGTIDLGGRYVASDPDDQPGDLHTLTLAVPAGALTFDEGLVPEGLSVERVVGRDGSTTIVLDGDLTAINDFLAAPGSLTYSVAPFFAGVVPLTITLTNHPGSFFPAASTYSPLAPSQSQNDAPNAFEGVAALAFVPAADHVFPSAADAVTPQDTPVALSITLSALADTDGSESVLVVLEGVPAGATFNHGTDLGGGQWALAAGDLADLTFTPPPGASGAFTLTVKAIVTDSAPGLTSATAPESTTSTVTGVPAPAATPAPTPVTPFIPPATAPAAGTFGTAVAAGAVADAGGTGTGSDARPSEAAANRVAFVNAYSSAASTDASSPTETRVGYSPPSPGSLFAQMEVPLPSYGNGEKHPLPPVLPLDQTLPVAGFTESGGDSFALIDKLYRDAAGVPAAARPGAALSEEAIARVADLVEPIRVAVAPLPQPESTAAPPAPEAVEASAEWRFWVAGAAVAAALAAWGWLTRGSDGRLSRAVFRLLRLPHRRPTQRTA